MKKVIMSSLIAVVCSVSTLASADSLQNLERQRALFLKTNLASSQGVSEMSLPIIEGRLMDLERAVANDKSLETRFSSHARRALSNYDLTFLVHSAAEAKKPTFAHWVDQIGLSAADVKAAQVGRY